ncbi:MAG: aminotransferase class I/II-fold pyridoxal phosphate-dependent enzyme [Bacteroidetes bacterium]|jgi:aspartate/methionine/tyrosine aminotransferase|nr:aminotransferase class I/II-fold pyridoxal phosphate-dependent enzyme [Bacteroidota bacterium]
MKKFLNFAYGTNELPELRAWQDKWKHEADNEDYYSIADFHGIPELQKAVHDRFVDRGVKNGCSAHHVMITSGGTEALFSSLLWIKSKGGTVVLQHPSWSYFSDTLQLLNIPFIYSRADSASELRLDLESLNPDGTFLFILTNPSNPFSHIFSEDYLKVLSEWVSENEKIMCYLTKFTIGMWMNAMGSNPGRLFMVWKTVLLSTAIPKQRVWLDFG